MTRSESCVRPILIAASALLAGCLASRDPEPLYQPTENVLEAVAVLRLHVPDDTYRFPPARDFAGKNVYRASLNRLESLEEIHAEKFKSGYLVDVLLFAKGRALERIAEYDLASKHYARVEVLESVLNEPAAWSKAVTEELHEASRLEPAHDASLDEAMRVYDGRRQRLEELLGRVEGTHYVPVVREEIERADMARARYFRARRRLEPSLDAVSLQQYQRLVQNHKESKYRNEHLLELGDLYAELSRDYVGEHPPESLNFDAATFDEYAFSATRLYEAVSQQDGAIEKIEAARKLEAFLAFTMRVYDEKMPR